MGLSMLLGALPVGDMEAQGFLDKVVKGLEKTNQALESADRLFGGQNTQRSRRKAVKGFRIESPHPDLEISCERCIASSTTVLMDFYVVNYGADATLDFMPYNNVAIDDAGTQYAMQVRVADGEWVSATSAAGLFPTEVPIKLSVQIKDVPEEVQMFRRLHLNINCPRLNLRGSDPIKVYNLPILRRPPMAMTMSMPHPAHPLVDPLVQLSGMSYSPVLISYIPDDGNDLSRMGLAGKVRQIQEKRIDGNPNGKAQTHLYRFNEAGMLEYVETPFWRYHFSYQDGKRYKITEEYEDGSSTKEYTVFKDKDNRFVFGDDGKVLEDNLYFPVKYAYAETGFCSGITYQEDYETEMGTIQCAFERNDQGDICHILEQTSFSDGAKNAQQYEIKYQYDAQGNWTSLRCDSEAKYMDWQRTLEYYE